MNLHIKKAIDLFGGKQTALAYACNVSQPAVRKWLYGGAISPESASAIERATKGAVRRQDLRPQDWHLIWPELRAA